MEAQLRQLGLAAQRIEAVTPDDINSTLLDRHTSRRHVEHATPTELSCTLSHHKALIAFLASDETHALVLEDDVILSRTVPDLLARPLPDFDILRLETYFDPQHHFLKRTMTFGQWEAVPIGCRCAGAAAYIIGRHAAQAVLEAERARSRPYDFVIFYPFRLPGRRLQVLQLKPALAVQDDRLNGTPYAGDVQKQAERRAAKPHHLRAAHALAYFWLSDVSINIEKTVNRLLRRTTREIVPLAADIHRAGASTTSA